MKIGILTYHRSNNYGALLQAIALRSILENAGHQATYIDYWPGYHKRMYANFSLVSLTKKKGIRAKYFYIKVCLLNLPYRMKRKKNFALFINHYIEPYISTTKESYDIIIHGSDQIWRKQPELNTYNPIYFGKHLIHTNKKISYAASMGILPHNNADKQLLKSYLQSLNCISVREESLLQLLQSLGYNNVYHDLDPTLLLPSEFWIQKFHLKPKNNKYALYYCLQDAFDISELNKYVQSKGLKLKIIYNRAACRNTEDIYTVSNPVEFLELMYGAEMVFTSSFHGLAFSIIFHKPFWASYKKNSDRAESLLCALNLSSRMLPPYSSLFKENDSIDYNTIEEHLNRLRYFSLSHIKEMLK